MDKILQKTTHENSQRERKEGYYRLLQKKFKID